ncbi:uncharacterized protein TA16105 [Theileria annulata]|uniref:AP2/ERF domain-containing protein n=1 Tax=Theileria annulata TaxID=5874 RepID=Q4UIG3_THEAN|nr:uncharacterized protein TA16105 [Theileria annulata]CAI73126.1 hypothetical protein, conserved [Theileria annulata]|eukprot:XP_953804.1 hypothetical protein, conserved [Theileria annulata]
MNKIMNSKENKTNLEAYLSWIDAILNLCNKIDSVCTKLDKKFPSGANSSHLKKYKHSINVYEIIKHYSWQNNIRTKDLINKYKNNSEWKLENIIKNTGKTYNNEMVQINCGNKACLGHFGLNGEISGTKLIKRRGEDKVKIEQGFKIDLNSKCGNKRNQDKRYELESEILKNLEVGQKIFITSKSSTKKSVEFTKITQDYDYLLNGKAGENKIKIIKYQELFCDVPGVYWDKRSWIASWYQHGKRYYRSFSAKLYGFNRAKYFAIQSRLSNLNCSRKYTPRKHSKYIV